MQISTRILNSGGAVWERIKDRFVLAAGDTYTTVGVGNVTSGDGIGGEATHTLTTSEMPKHTHTISHTHNINHRHDSCSFSGTTGYPISNTSTSASITTSSDGAFTVSFRSSYASSASEILFDASGKASIDGNGDTAYDLNRSSNHENHMDRLIVSAHSHSFNHRHSVTCTGNTSYANTSSGAASTSTSGSNGSSTAHNNMPPYIVKYCWERIA